MQQTGAEASSSFFIFPDSSSLKVENAVSSSSFTKFSSFVFTAREADAASSIFVVLSLLFNLVCADILFLLRDFDHFKPSLDAVHPVEE